MYQAGDIIALTASAWRLRAPLAASSYGVLWKAESCNGGAPAALKLVNVEQMTLALPPQRACWTRCAALETGILRSLQPWDRRHIVALLDSGEHLGQPALALELLEGDLARHLDALAGRGDSVGFSQALDWITQVNSALAKLHQYGWRHLDLKPSNLLLGDGGATLKLADFGTSRALAERAPHAYSGTASWQAPEQFFPHEGQSGGYRTDARADYFALGALFYRLVTGKLLRYAETCAAAYREHGSDGAARLRALHRGALPPVLEAEEAALFLQNATRQGDANAAGAEAALILLRTLLAPRPEGRPRHALEISRLLARAGAGLGCALPPLRSAA